MSQNINTGGSTLKGDINLAGALPIPSTAQEIINAWTNPGTTSTLIYEVPTDKVFYLFGWVQGHDSVAGIQSLYKDATKILSFSTTTSNLTGNISSSVPICKFVAGEQVKAICPGGTGSKATIWGVLVNA